MTAAAAELRRQVVAAVMAEAGQGRVPDRTALARQFQGHAPASTLARWIAAAIEEAHHNLTRDNSGAPEPPPSSASGNCGEAPESSMAAVQAESATRPVPAANGRCDHTITAAPDSGGLWDGWDDAELHRLDQWRQFQIGLPSRAEAVRRLALAALRPGT